MSLPQFILQRDHHSPLYLQLYHRYREAIAHGQLQAGERVPSVRSLASELNLSRGTVEQAYQILVSEGYFITQGAGGTRVSPQLAPLVVQPPTHTTPEPPIPEHSTLSLGSTSPQLFELGLPALDAFPRKTWARLANYHLRTIDILSYPDPAGYAPLRHTIATYLGISRGIHCSPEQVFITAGYAGALQLITQTVLKTGDLGWYENPGYLFARQALQHAGMRLQPISVDAEGLNVEGAKRLAPQARFAVVTPTHQSPLGVTLSLARRLALLDWAQQQQAWIIEDDYDSEFRYHGRPLPALKSLDQNGRVLYTGTFSKVLFPGMRLAYLVVPPEQITTFRYSAQQMSYSCPLLTQATTADFMQQGHFMRHLRKMRTLYAERYQYLTDALRHYAQEMQIAGLEIPTQIGGMHILIHLASTYDDQAIARVAYTQGMNIQALSTWSLAGNHHTAQRGLMIGFTNFMTTETAQYAVKKLLTVIKNATNELI